LADATPRFGQLAIARNINDRNVAARAGDIMSRPMLTMDITVGDERATVKPAGEIDLATARDVQERATQLLHRPIDHLTFDMREVVMVDSVGLATLLRVAQQAEAADCAFTLLNPSPLLRRVLHVTGLSRVLNVQTSKD
jgi:anti-sigma B factor antagonist